VVLGTKRRVAPGDAGENDIGAKAIWPSSSSSITEMTLAGSTILLKPGESGWPWKMKPSCRAPDLMAIRSRCM